MHLQGSLQMGGGQETESKRHVVWGAQGMSLALRQREGPRGLEKLEKRKPAMAPVAPAGSTLCTPAAGPVRHLGLWPADCEVIM